MPDPRNAVGLLGASSNTVRGFALSVLGAPIGLKALLPIVPVVAVELARLVVRLEVGILEVHRFELDLRDARDVDVKKLHMIA